MKQHRKCEICGNETNLLSINEIRYFLPDSYKIPSRYEIVACKNCGFCYADTLASIDDYNHYYTHYNYYSGVKHVRTLNDMSKNVTVDLLNEISTKQSLILDIGFGDGEQLLLLKEAGYENLFGIDPSEESVEHIKNFGVSAEVGNIYDLEALNNREMDIVIATGVLEHLIRPSLALETISKILKKDGLLIVTAPNCLNLVNDFSPMSNNFNQEHINYFSPISLKNLMGKIGFFEERIITGENYTDMLAVFCYKGGKEYTNNKFVKDEGTAEAIKVFIERQKNSENVYNKKIEKFVQSEALVAIWGTGAFAMSLLSNTDLQYCKIACFADNNLLKWGSQLYGVQIVSPNDVVNNTHIEAIVIASIKSAEEISKQLLELGWDKEIIIM